MAKEVAVMARQKSAEPRKQYTSTLREDLLQGLQRRSEITGIPMSKILDKAVEEYLRRELMNDVMR